MLKLVIFSIQLYNLSKSNTALVSGVLDALTDLGDLGAPPPHLILNALRPETPWNLRARNPTLVLSAWESR